MNYFQRLQFEMVASNSKGSTQKTHGAWENKKAKSARNITPRGSAFKRMDALYTNIWRITF
jgi:hypothetical protein